MRPRSTLVLFLSLVLAILMSDRPACSDPPNERYVFVENTNRWVVIIRGEWQLIGKLDKNGDFIQDKKYKKGQGGSRPSSVLINSSGHASKSKKVYEFRSGALIPGEIQPDGQFVPQVGGKIIPFKDYNYSPTATPIWNLPGVFLTEEEAAKLEMAKLAEKK